jgi:tetratricopeptide (TPR) repeat protein
MAAAWAAHAQTINIGQGWARDRAKAAALAQRFALKAIALDPYNAEAMAIYAHICSFHYGDFETALEYFDRALRLNQNSGFIWALSAATYCYIGKPQLGLRRLQRYQELTEVDPYSRWHDNYFTVAHLFNGDYDSAISTGRRGVEFHPGFTNAIKPLIASFGHLGRRDEAKPYVDRLLTLEPDFTVEQFARIYPFKLASDRERYIDGLRLAGMPKRA